MNAYAGKMLMVNLTRGQIREEPIDADQARSYIGGRGLGTRMLYDRMDPKADALSAGNVLIFATGPLTGTAAPTGGRFMVVTKGALTGAIASSNCGGNFGPELKYAGYDMIVVEGRSPKPVVLIVDDGRARLEPAGRLWGQTSSVVEDQLHERLGGEFKIACIGPAGERLVRYACVINDKNRAAGRSGVGAVMGFKRLKAIAVRGSGGLTVADAKGFRRACLETIGKLKAAPVTGQGLPMYGTASLVNVINEHGLFPTRNFQQGQFEGAERISGEAIRERILVRNRACFACPVACGRVSQVVDGKYAGKGEGPEYETIWSLGADVGVDHLEAATKTHYICNEVGMDPITFGGTLACAMELYEAGVLDGKGVGYKLNFGNYDAMVELASKTGYRRGFGDELAEGGKRLAAKFGRPEAFMGVKGQEFPAYDPRGAVGMGLQYATSNRGACHVRGYMIAPEILGMPTKLDPRSPKGKAAMNIALQDTTAALDSAGLCLFITFGVGAEEMVGMLGPATGFAYDVKELVLAGERIWNLERLFNLRAGLSRKDDTLPRRLLTEPMPAGPAKGMTVPLEVMLKEYYRLRGWDVQGRPTRKKLESLGLA